MHSLILLAAVYTGDPVATCPDWRGEQSMYTGNPVATCPVWRGDEIYPLRVCPIPHSSDAYPGEVPFPGLPRPAAQTQSLFPSQAILIIRLPPDADLYINTIHIRSASNRRAFVTPDMLPDQAYYYDLKVRVVREFRPYVQSQRVIFRPGEAMVVTFSDLFPDVPFEPGWH